LFGPSLPLPPPSALHPPRFQAEPVLPFSPILLKRRHKHNKRDILREVRVQNSMAVPTVRVAICYLQTDALIFYPDFLVSTGRKINLIL
jgi:hypothetical protein